MNKRKLVRIIVKDLEELKMLAVETAEVQGDSSLIVELALSKARLVCQEIELLRKFSSLPVPNKETSEEETSEADKAESMAPDTELEILNFGEQNFPEEDEPGEEETFETKPGPEEIEDGQPAEQDQEEEKIEPEFVVDETRGDDLNENIEEEEAEDQEDEDLPEPGDEEDEDDLTEEDEDDEDDDDDTEESNLSGPAVQVTELKINSPGVGVREIHIDDLDEEYDSIQFEPLSASNGRPVMREIPKPENQVQEKTVVGESFRKERSLNDVIGENKSVESKLTNGPITSLRAAIGLNDRFLFIREIFENNTDKYNMIIDHLDKLETIQQAVDYLKANLTLQKNETSLKFVDLLKRRFTK